MNHRRVIIKSKIFYFFVLLSLLFLSSCSTIFKNYKTSAIKQSGNFTVTDENGSNALPKTNLLKEQHTVVKTEFNSDNDFYSYYSNKLGINLSGKENKRLIEESSQWIGVPYKYGGCTKEGTDCSGFTTSIYTGIYGIKLKRNSAEMMNEVQAIKKEELSDGDLVFFWTDTQNKTNHVGIYINDNKFVHSSIKKGVIVNDLNEPYYIKHFTGAGRVKK